MGIAMPDSERARAGADSLIRPRPVWTCWVGVAVVAARRLHAQSFKRLGNIDMGVIPVEDVSERLLRPGSTCWRLERTDRMALLVDGAAYFPAMKAAMREARHSILLLGWDFDSRVPLQPDLEGAEQSDRLCDLLGRLLAQRPGLHVHILIWDIGLAVRDPAPRPTATSRTMAAEGTAPLSSRWGTSAGCGSPSEDPGRR